MVYKVYDYHLKIFDDYENVFLQNEISLRNIFTYNIPKKKSYYIIRLLVILMLLSTLSMVFFISLAWL